MSNLETLPPELNPAMAPMTPEARSIVDTQTASDLGETAINGAEIGELAPFETAKDLGETAVISTIGRYGHGFHRVQASEFDITRSGPSKSTLRQMETEHIAADVLNFSPVDFLSNHQAAKAVGIEIPMDYQIRSPIEAKQLKKRWVIKMVTEFDEKARWVRERDPRMVEADGLLTDLQTGVDQLSKLDDTNTELLGKASSALRWTLRDAILGNGNIDLILRDSDISPFVLSRITARGADKPPEKTQFEHFLQNASRDELVNFAQAYLSVLRRVDTPEQREARSASFKESYLTLATKAAKDGWLERKSLAKISKTLPKIKTVLFSPFSSQAKDAAGQSLKSHTVLLPTIVSEAIAIHEFTHQSGDVVGPLVRQILEAVPADEKASYAEETFLVEQNPHLYSVAETVRALNEGLTEHLTRSLINGKPETVSPVQRVRGEALPEEKTVYQTEREMLSILLGPERPISDNALSREEASVKALNLFVQNDGKGLSELFDRQWGGISSLLIVSKVIKSAIAEKNITNDSHFLDKIKQALIEASDERRS